MNLIEEQWAAFKRDVAEAEYPILELPAVSNKLRFIFSREFKSEIIDIASHYEWVRVAFVGGGP